MKRRWVIVAITSIALIGVGTLVRIGRENRQLARDVTDFRIRAEQADAEAQFKLGSIYSKGKGVPKDSVEAVRWYRKSAAQGYAKAEYNLCYMYQEGKGVPQDYAEAERWCRRAAEHGDPKGQDGLGSMYFRGVGIAQDYSEAAHWYRKSAEQGFANAQYDLGYMYYYGYGMPQDRIEASRLFHQAAAQGNEDARRAIGLNRAHVPATTKSTLLLKVLASLYFGIAFLKSGNSNRTSAKIAAVLAVLFILSFVLDLFWYSYVGHLQSATTFTALYFVRHLVGGVIIAMLGPFIHARGPKIVLIGAVVLFIAFVVLGVVLSELWHIPVTIRFFCFSGLIIGMAVPSAIFLWLDSKKTRQQLVAAN
jgi:hypothetical protein